MAKLPVKPHVPTHAEKFEEVLSEVLALHTRKSKDYGSDEDPLANIKASAEFGVEPWIGALVRLNDKIYRLKRHASGHALANETAEDSLIDICVYAPIALVLFREAVEASKEK
jgi:dsDNA-specific endonuclease/ATPase MutS2